MARSKIFIVVLFVAFTNIYLSKAQWSPITNNNIWSLNSGSVAIGTTAPNIYSKVHSETTPSDFYTFNYLAKKNSTATYDVASIGLGVTIDANSGGIKGGIYFQRSTSNGIGDLKFAINSIQSNVNVTANDALMTIKSNGFVGIGTISPTEKLQIGNLNNSENLKISIPGVYNFEQVKLGQYGNGSCGLELVNHGSTTTSSGVRLLSNIDDGIAGLQIQTAVPVSTYQGLNYVTRLAVATNGYVGIGTTNPDQLLTVNGTIHAKEVKVDLTGPLADYVFNTRYKLMPLSDIEQYINKNSHLPEMPSAAEVSKNGLSIGEMQNKLLQKIEELTLYVIEQDKKIERLEKAQK